MASRFTHKESRRILEVTSMVIPNQSDWGG